MTRFRFLFFSSFILLFPLLQTMNAQDRVIRPGDSIDIVVYGHQELSRVVTVGQNGGIDFPFMQNIPVDGMTLEELRRFMVVQLARYLDGQPVVTVGFSQSQLIQVAVLGYVEQPGTVQLPLNATLQEAIAKAGGPLEGANLQAVQVIREEDDDTNTRSFNIEFLYLRGDLSENPALSDQDVVLVTGNPNYAGVKVIGEVNEPGIHPTTHGATLLDVIFQAGGFTEDANVEKIRYIPVSEASSQEVEIDLESYYKDPESHHLPMVKPGDLVIIPRKSQWFRRTISFAADLTSIASIIYYITLVNRYRN